MKRAKFILAALILVTIAGGAVAFKAARFNANPFYTLTTITTINGQNYVKLVNPAIPFCYTVSTAFTTQPNNPSFVGTLYTTNGTTTTTPITLKRVGGPETVTIPAWTCNLTETFYQTIQ